MTGIFKKYIGVNGKVDEKSKAVLGECVRGYAGLCALSGWEECEDEESMQGLRSDVNGGVAGNGFSASNGARLGRFS